MNETTETAVNVDEHDPRRIFIRDAVIFHGKLLLDGLRDFILFPVTLVAALVDLVQRKDPPGRHFYDAVHFGRETEKWIDLFEAASRAPPSEQPRPNMDGPSLDDFVDDIETKVRERYEKGELSAAARDAVEQIMEAARKAVDRGRR